MDGRDFSLLAGAGSAILLLGAFAFQAAGYAPCELCILQRWPHVAAVLIAVLVWLTRQVRILATLGMFAAVIATGLAVYHAGVELRLWTGPSHCSGTIGNLASMSPQDLMARLQSAPVVRCDEVAFRFLGLSMAGWNAILSTILAGMWGFAARRGDQGQKM